MASTTIESLYIYDQNNEVILEHTYRSPPPPPARACIAAYLSDHSSFGPSTSTKGAGPTGRVGEKSSAVSYHTSLSPPATLIASRHNGLVFLVPSSRDSDVLAVLTFIGRLVDVLEEFLGLPLTASRITSSYDVVAQILAEMVDGGQIATTESNALRESVTTQGWVDKLFGGVGLPSGTPAPSFQSGGGNNFSVGGSGGLGGSGMGSLRSNLLSSQSPGPQVPWRRSNVRHTSNELYVDMIESLHVLLAPSGRPLSARVHGSILFTARISGVPDLVLQLSSPGGGRAQVARMVEAPSFHPCVRLNRWRDNPGELSFVPPDGKFMLAGYEVDLLPPISSGDEGLTGRSAKQLDLPVSVEIRKSLGTTGMDFEVRLAISASFGSKGGSGSVAATQLRAIAGKHSGRTGSGRSTPSLFGSRDAGSTSAPLMNDLIVHVPVPPSIRNVRDLRVSRGEARFDVSTHVVEWRINGKEAGEEGVATLRCTVIGPVEDDGDDDEEGADGQETSYGATGMGDYDETADAYQGEEVAKQSSVPARDAQEDRDARKVQMNKIYMPNSATISFSIKGWLASGLKVESLNIDTRKSRGLGDGVKPVKGAKYITVSRRGVETRC